VIRKRIIPDPEGTKATDPVSGFLWWLKLCKSCFAAGGPLRQRPLQHAPAPARPQPQAGPRRLRSARAAATTEADD
jgi:hypothetical protein